MRPAAPPLLAVLRSALQGEILALVLADPEREWTVGELAERTGGAYSTVAEEVRRLEDGDLVRSATVGRTKLLSANDTSVYFRPLAELVLLAFGPPQVLADELASVDGIDDVLIYGSWAARYDGAVGPEPNDIDILVLGSPDPDEIHSAARRCERRLGREVNMTIRDPSDWRRARDGFSRQVKSSPIIAVVGPWSS